MWVHVSWNMKTGTSDMAYMTTLVWLVCRMCGRILFEFVNHQTKKNLVVIACFVSSYYY